MTRATPCIPHCWNLEPIGKLAGKDMYRCKLCGLEYSCVPPARMFCAVCTKDIASPSASTLEPFGRDGAQVRVCIDCSSSRRHPSSTGRRWH